VQSLLGIADGKKLVGGNLCDAWLLQSVPADLLTELEKRRREHCCRSVADGSHECTSPWPQGGDRTQTPAELAG
jgi:hypothetical protein